MAEKDVLSELFSAWREDIDSVPFPHVGEVLIPRQQTRARHSANRCPECSGVRVTNATHGADS